MISNICLNLTKKKVSPPSSSQFPHPKIEFYKSKNINLQNNVLLLEIKINLRFKVNKLNRDYNKIREN